MYMRRAAGAGVLSLFVMAGAAQEIHERDTPQTQEQLHARVMALYDFHPGSVGDDVRKAKSAQMDVFWDEMKARPAVSVPLLRTELRSRTEPSFFYTDGVELLLHLSHEPQDGALAAATLPRMELGDTQPTTYFYLAHDLAVKGEDITAGALHILDDPTFSVSVPQHAMTLDQRMALMYLLLSMKEDIWVSAALQRFAMEKSEKGKIALVFALFYAQTDESDAALRRIAGDSAQASFVRKQAQDLLSNERAVPKDALAQTGNVDQIREQRRQRLRAVSDEAVDDVQAMTKELVALRAKGRG